MFVKTYTAMWLAAGFVAGVLFLSGNFSMVTAVVFGFIGFGLVFMGMMCVLPSTVAHPAPPKDLIPQAAKVERLGKTKGAVPEFILAWFNPAGVEIRKVRY